MNHIIEIIITLQEWPLWILCTYESSSPSQLDFFFKLFFNILKRKEKKIKFKNDLPQGLPLTAHFWGMEVPDKDLLFLL